MPAGQSSRARKHGVVATSTSAARSPGPRARELERHHAAERPAEHGRTCGHVRRDGAREVAQRRRARGPRAAAVAGQVDEMQARAPRERPRSTGPTCRRAAPSRAAARCPGRRRGSRRATARSCAGAGVSTPLPAQCLQRCQQLVDLRRRVRRREREAQARRAGGTVGGRIAGTQKPRSNRASLAATGGRFIADAGPAGSACAKAATAVRGPRCRRGNVPRARARGCDATVRRA